MGGNACWFAVATLAAAAGIAGCGAEASEAVGQGAQAADVDAPGISVTDAQLAAALRGRLKPLRAVPVRAPVGGATADAEAATRLGKAFFWDVQASGDGKTACATCHYAAGADDRRHNIASPGPDGRFQIPGIASPGQIAPAVPISSDDRFGSPGVASSVFVSLSTDPRAAADVCTPSRSPVFHADRQVTERNTPSVIGAVFMRELFWDGRASHVFNGQNPFGTSGNAGLLAPNAAMEAGALASQATGPANNEVEMACAGRGFDGPQGLGAKLLGRVALQFQTVAPTDSVLGALSAWPEPGLRCGDEACTYRDLVAAAFGSSAKAGFARIWGEAIQAYESTLIPDETPLDRYLAGDLAALTPAQKSGLHSFATRGRCIECHAGAELSDASWSFADEHGLVNEDGGDQGFHNIGVRPVSAAGAEDLGRAAKGPGGVSFSVTGSRADRGAFKTPMLRNVKLTAPYFHNGGKATLRQVVDMYRGPNWGDYPHTSVRVRQAALFDHEVAPLIDFLENALTDCRVEKHQAPFDHPSLDVSDGPSLPAVGASGTGACP